MRKCIMPLFFGLLLLICRCGSDKESDRFELLIGPVWASDSLLVNGADAGGPGQFLYKFKGDAKFNRDGTGTFGKYTGTWWFTESQTQIVISSDSLQIPLTNRIIELTTSSLKIRTAVPDPGNLSSQLQIRMTFKAK